MGTKNFVRLDKNTLAHQRVSSQRNNEIENGKLNLIKAKKNSHNMKNNYKDIFSKGYIEFAFNK